jgi:hypothetical protein
LARPILVAVFVAVAVLAGSMIGAMDFHSAFATTTYIVTTSSGISLNEAIDAFNNEDIKDRLGLDNIQIFSKSGGSSAGGQRQAVLRVDLPEKITSTGDSISFQYFVDTKNDMNGEMISHCGDVRLHEYLDARKVYVSKWLGYDGRTPDLPLKTEKITVHEVPTGWHDIGLIPEARSGGCNSGFIQSWGGTAVVFK